MSLPKPDPRTGPAIPLARWADRQLKAMGETYGLTALSGLEGATLMGERGANGGYRIGGRISAGLGGSRLMPTRDGGWFALTLIRAEDRELLPALFGDARLAIDDPAAIAAATLQHDCADLVKRGRALGLPVASADEVPASPPVTVMTRGQRRERPAGHRPLVIDLSAIWAGPLAGHLFWQAGMEVVKVESRTRPDLIRRDDPTTFDLINQGKANVLVDFASTHEKAALIALIRSADVVIESSRPRALRHLGIDAETLVREVPGLVWLSVTGHGASGDAANWVGIGNDCGVAGGLSRAMAELTGEIGYVGDAIADPLTGITAAREGLAALRSGEAQRIGLSMTAISAMALAEERAFNRAAIDAELRAWGTAAGQPFPHVARRVLQAEVHEIGADTTRYLPGLAQC
ncbi:CoA transferase [Novosphingobium mangrovi (ex Huang et al. 2023)]|uniref:CoA transferase n=1 Tax=Novosphingobium mangrovi (ex Huang et al. 2023) TaxID=2976432 RepID=A0ABT2I7N6_9SPHN|nr:CoA transferase [Novosphingobium mangrovi (ex Huang et al. 2023)]MCT2400804.1 CoA transferase [Novosphingobium mangrovi (ex Huang et al. 2023)]